MAGGAQQGRRRAGGLDLGVLRVVDASGEAGRQVRFPVGEFGGGHVVGGDAGGALPVREGAERGESGLVGRDDETALGLVLDVGLRGEGRGEFAPEPGGQEREVELGSGFLVGDEEVALAGPGGAAGDGAAVDDGDGEAGAGRVVGAGRPDDSGADDHGVEGVGWSRGHSSNISHGTARPQDPSTAARGRRAGHLFSGPSQVYEEVPAVRSSQTSTGPKEQFMSARLGEAAAALSSRK